MAEESFWDRGKANWNEAWQDPDTRQGMMDIGVGWLQDQTGKEDRIRAAIGDNYVDTIRGKSTRSADVQEEVASPSLYTQLRKVQGRKEAKEAAKAREDKWDKLLERDFALQERDLDIREGKLAKDETDPAKPDVYGGYKGPQLRQREPTQFRMAPDLNYEEGFQSVLDRFPSK